MVHKVYLYKKQENLGNRNKMRRATGETRSDTADYRIPGISISTMKLQDARRQNNVTKLIVDMTQTEIFELYENSAKLECPDYNAISEIGIIYCSCGRNLKYKRSPTTFQKTNCYFTSIPSFVIKKNSRRGPKHGVSERQVMFYRAKQMLKKARQAKHGNHPTKLSRWYAQEKYRDSLAKHNIGEKVVLFFGRIALERHDYTATRAERLQNAKHWILRLNADGPQNGPVLEHTFASEAHRTRMLSHVPHMPRPMPREQDLLHGAGDALWRDTCCG